MSQNLRISPLSLLAVILLLRISNAAPAPTPIMPVFQGGNQILFQGDSITDGNRGRSADPNHILGHGYVFIIAAKYGDELAGRNLAFFNRGVSGHKVSDLAGRWQNDTLDLKPDILSILIGVNDASANVSAEQYEATYEKILRDTIAANPKVRLVLIEPFTLPGAKHAADWEAWRANIQGKQGAVARLAARYGAALVHAQRAFDEAARRAPAEYWIWDTIHPTYAGHQVLANEWVKTVGAFPFSEHPKIEALPIAPQNPAPNLIATPSTTPRELQGEPQGAFSLVSASVSHNTNPIVLGWKFTTGDKALDVSALGYFNDGAGATHQVGIYTAATQNLVGTAVSVTTVGGSLAGDSATFSFVKPAQPIRLEANTTYIIAGTTKGTGWLEKAKNFHLAYGISPTSVQCVFKFGPEELAFPDTTNAVNDPVLLGPNFRASMRP